MPATQPEVDYDELARELLLPYKNPDTDETELPDRVKSYLEIMENGLEGEASPPKRIVVIGAGMAGILILFLTLLTTVAANPAFIERIAGLIHIHQIEFVRVKAIPEIIDIGI